MNPVSPMPPIVASKASAFSRGEQRSVSPEEVRSVSSSTCRPNVPSTWWFLPWTSAARAPPTVTKRVPGTTGRKKPRGTRNERRRASDVPPSHVTVQPLLVEVEDPPEPLGQDDRAAAVQGRVAVAAAESAREEGLLRGAMPRRPTTSAPRLGSVRGALLLAEPPPAREGALVAARRSGAVPATSRGGGPSRDTGAPSGVVNTPMIDARGPARPASRQVREQRRTPPPARSSRRSSARGPRGRPAPSRRSRGPGRRS